MGRSLLSSPFFVSTSAAFLFWFLLWFACILAFSFELRVDVASLELRLAALIVLCDNYYSHSGLCLPFSVVYFFLPGFQYRNWNFLIRITVRDFNSSYQTDISSSKSVISNEIVESSSQLGEPFKRKPLPLSTKSLWSMKRTSTWGCHYVLTVLNKSLPTSRETNFRLIQAFNWSKNNFGEIHISQGLDWAFPSLSHYGSCTCTTLTNTCVSVQLITTPRI